VKTPDIGNCSGLHRFDLLPSYTLLLWSMIN